MNPPADAMKTKTSAQSLEAVSGWRRYVNGLIAKEISALTRYYDRVIQWQPLARDTGLLLNQIDAPVKDTSDAQLRGFTLKGDSRRNAILINGNFNHHYDIQSILAGIAQQIDRSSRVVAVLYNPYLSGLYRLANALGIRKGEQPTTFITETDFKNIAALSGFELVRHRPVAYFPWKLLGIGSLINWILPIVPVARWFAFASVAVLRPRPTTSRRPSLSIVIPARNEKGNIENALKRMPDFGAEVEVIFVEGHSKDQTWEEILRVKELYASKYRIKAFKQPGKGKNDAVKTGFANATCELLTILDADLTMPPELLTRFYDAYCEGLADFINGTRLVYPMEGEAMRFLNRLGNAFFAKALSFVLDQNLGDSLCGTKLVRRDDYERMTRWRKDFGEFDPFGDFELLFPASILGLGVIDIPIRYLARTYGTTNISRFRHGLMLLKMTLVGLFRIKTGR